MEQVIGRCSECGAPVDMPPWIVKLLGEIPSTICDACTRKLEAQEGETGA